MKVKCPPSITNETVIINRVTDENVPISIKKISYSKIIAFFHIHDGV